MKKYISNEDFLKVIAKADELQEKHDGTLKAIEGILKISKNANFKKILNDVINDYVEYSFNPFSKKVVMISQIPVMLSKKLVSKNNQLIKSSKSIKQKNNKQKEYIEKLKSL